MRSDPRSRALALALVLVCAPAGITGATPAPKPPTAVQKAPPAAPGKNTLRDRIVAVVDEDPILASDLERVIALGLVKPAEGEADRAFRRRVLDQMIEDRLRLHEIDRFGLEQVPVEEIERRVTEIRAGFPDEAAFQRTLKEVGLTLGTLRQLVARQLVVMTYVDERLGPRVFIDSEDIKAYYDSTLAPEMRRRGQPVPPLDDVREDIRNVLRQQRLNQEIRRWTAELRKDADIAVYFDAPDGPLPPVIKTLDKSGEKEDKRP
jgi:parvulin-like peptidyl-prolyl isomerase